MSETVVISSAGLNPSNRDAGFPNLARGQNPPIEVIAEVTAIAEAELKAAGIDVHIIRFFPGSRGEVPSNAHGTLAMWGFERAWYYWIAKGPGIPVELAEQLHATHGKVVRVAGHCGCPSPREWYKGFGVGDYHVDSPEGLRALADVLRSIFAERPDKADVETLGRAVEEKGVTQSAFCPRCKGTREIVLCEPGLARAVECPTCKGTGVETKA